MSILAGIVSLIPNGGNSTPRGMDLMLSALKQQSESTIVRREGSWFSVVSIDTRAFNVPGHLSDDNGRFTAVAGWPIVRTENARPLDRAGDVKFLHDSVTTNATAKALASCCGQFAMLHVDPKRHRFVIACDKGGHRPLYWARLGDQLYFSTMLRLLEAVPNVVRDVNLRGVVEHANCGYPLADRTPYANVKLIEPGTYLELTDSRVESSCYYSLCEIKPFQGNREEALDELYGRFELAVKDRTASTGMQRSFLSGGLDARAVVMALRANDFQVQTVTFDKNGFPDGHLAAEFARKVGTQHITKKFKHRSLQSDLMANVFRLCPQLDDGISRTIFTGDGGSVGLGLVYVTESILERLNDADMLSAVQLYVSRKPLVRRVFRRRLYEQIKDCASAGVLSELQQRDAAEPLQRFYLFLLRNDQRRHLHNFYEQIDEYRCELLTPFYDPRVLELVASCPLKWFVFHRFYHDWLRRFPPDMTSVAWQTYPGHEPCPLPVNHGNQWERTYSQSVALGVPTAIAVLKEILSGRFPSKHLRFWPVTLAAVLQLSGLSNKRAALRTALTFCRYTGSGNSKSYVMEPK